MLYSVECYSVIITIHRYKILGEFTALVTHSRPGLERDGKKGRKYDTDITIVLSKTRIMENKIGMQVQSYI